MMEFLGLSYLFHIIKPKANWEKQLSHKCKYNGALKEYEVQLSFSNLMI